jgi:hypothetical protein
LTLGVVLLLRILSGIIALSIAAEHRLAVKTA